MRQRATSICLGVAMLLAGQTPTLAQVAAKPAAPAVPSKCTVLADDWRSIEIKLANNAADAVTDNSAPRATMRAAEDTVSYSKAQVTLRLMELNRCTLPDRAPSHLSFFGDALRCKTASLKANYDQLKAGLAECDYKNWKASF
jgi:hypothetical protein